MDGQKRFSSALLHFSKVLFYFPNKWLNVKPLNQANLVLKTF
jgi:hypothetical protein